MIISNGVNNTIALNQPLILKRGFVLKRKISLRLFWVLAILSIIALLVFYIFQVNAEISERYLIQKYQKRTEEFSKENKNLEINSVQINSLNNITALLEELNFEKTDKIHYIRVIDTQVVAK